MREVLNLYRFSNFKYRYSKFIELEYETQRKIINGLKNEKFVLIEIIAYCLMPTHLHLILKQAQDNGISRYMAKVLNSYSRFFNLSHRREGPLWAGRFKSVLVTDDEQLLHLTRYIHLNPTSANLVRDPQDWVYSSYLEYIDKCSEEDQLCANTNLFDVSTDDYRKFVLSRKKYQQEISRIKKLIIEDYTG